MASQKLVSINFVNINSQIFLEDSISFDSRSGRMLKCSLKDIPDYTCGIYLMWNDSLLDNKLPDFIGLGGEVMTKAQIRDKMLNGDDYIAFPGGSFSVRASDVLNNNDISDNDDFLLYNIKMMDSNDGLIDAKIVVWRFQYYTLVHKNKKQLLNYINELPVKVKYLRNKHVPSPLQ